ncbi:MAG: hypothetical protein DWQ01_21730 [Planctomycetota bacterium]|nr:MAG: hypothetical protein DWQ01_21730 [Planctomycetota bacterium]
MVHGSPKNLFTLEAIPPPMATAALGGLALVLALVGFMEPLAFLRWIDIPITLSLFVSAAYLSLAARKSGEWTLIGLFLAAAGAMISISQLFLSRNHPWVF